MSQDSRQCSNKTVNLDVVCHVPCVTGQSENKDISPNQSQTRIKCVKHVYCVNHCLCAPIVQNVPRVVQNPPVGARLQKFWQIWHLLGANPRVVSILQEGYNLPFKEKPPLTRSPVIISGYANPVKSKLIKDSLQELIQKQAVEKVIIPSSLAFYNRLFLVPKPNQKWRPILDLSQLNYYLATASFKMETPETIRLSLQKGEWVTSLDFSDAYFHIPIGQRSRKFLRFFLHSQAYQFTALPFGLSTAPLEFTKVAKEVKLMAQARGIRIHQYLDDWLLRAPCPETCLLHTRTLLDLCHRLGWVVNMTKSELVPQQVFNFVGYRFDLSVFPPVALLGKVVSKLLDQGFHRVILIAPGWPNMPWFWDLVSMSVQIPLSLPRVRNLLTQPFNQCPHRDLHSLNLHAWLLGPLPSNRQASLKKWQHELKLLRDVQPEPSTNQSGPFLSDGVRNIRWTSGLLL